MPKSVALILLNWNTPVHTANCILSLKQYCDEHLFDIIVADNGSADGSLTLLKTQFPELVFIDNKENLGFAEGNNRALTYSIDSGYLYSLIINNDTVVDEDIVTALSAHLNNYPQAAAVQPAIYWMYNRDKIWNGRGRYNKLWGTIKSDTTLPGPTPPPFEIADWVTGCCMMLRNTALKQSGLFNKLFFLYDEDVELSFRLRGAGYAIHYLPGNKIYHAAGGSANLKEKKKEGFLRPEIHYYINRNRIWVLRKYGSKFCYPIYIFKYGIYFNLLLFYFIVRGRNAKAKQLLKGIKDGLFTTKTSIYT